MDLWGSPRHALALVEMKTNQGMPALAEMKTQGMPAGIIICAVLFLVLVCGAGIFLSDQFGGDDEKEVQHRRLPEAHDAGGEVWTRNKEGPAPVRAHGGRTPDAQSAQSLP